MHDSFLTYSSYRWLWFTLVLLVASIVAYIWHAPIDGPNGGSWLGYTLGTIGALLIIWLMLIGFRKRSYNSNIGVLRGWLSAHVYLGTSLIVIATLHAGFQIGWNIHTLAYVLMMIVIISGFFGVYAYLRYPTLMTRNRSNASRDAMLEEIAELDDEALKLADKLGPKEHQIVVRSIQNTRLGGGVFAQLRGRRWRRPSNSWTRPSLATSDRKPRKCPPCSPWSTSWPAPAARNQTTCVS
jgi:hypothetical protein